LTSIAPFTNVTFCHCVLEGDGSRRQISLDAATEEDRKTANLVLQDDAGDGSEDGRDGDKSGARENP